MNALLYILKEFWTSAMEDWVFSFAILIWIGVVAYLKPFVHDGMWDAPILLVARPKLRASAAAQMRSRASSKQPLRA